MYCNKCGTKNNENDKFCFKCGNTLMPINENICSKCGANNNENDKFCFKCGNTLKQNINTNQIPIKKYQKILNKKTYGIVSIIILALSIFLCLTSNNIISLSKNDRTIMIYMVGADLESRAGLATVDLDSLDYNKITKNGNTVYLMAGGSSNWHNSYIDVNTTSIYKLTQNGFTKVEDRKLTDMGDAENLSHFLNYVYKNSKTSKYDLIFWNHGGAVDGNEYDELFFGDNLKITELKTAFENSNFKDENKLEIISFRTCLNSTLEMENVLKNYAKYIVASEEVTIGGSKAAALNFINEINKNDDAIDYGKKEIENYKQLVRKICRGDYCFNSTYSIVESKKLDKVVEEFDIFAHDINSNIKSNYNNMAYIRSNLSQYAEEDKTYDMIDLYDLSKAYGNYSNNAKKLQKAISKAVKYNWTNNYYSHGLSIYFPYNSTIHLDTYMDIAPSENYHKMITNFSNTKTNYARTTTSSYNSFSTSKVNVDKVEKEEADVSMKLTDKQKNNFATADYLVLADTKDGYYALVYRGDSIKLEGNTLKANVKSKILKISDIDYDDEEYWIASSEKEVTKEYTDLETTVLLYNDPLKLQVAKLVIRIDEKHPNGYIKNVYYNNEVEKEDKTFKPFAKVGLSLNDYTKIQVGGQYYKILDKNKKYNPNWINESNGIHRGQEYNIDEFKFIKEDFSGSEDYYVVIRVKDINNKEYYSNAIKIGD